MELDTRLLEIIDKVSQAVDERSAAEELLFPLLSLFDMDQAALCELRNRQVTCLFAMDRTRRILQDPRGLWLSQTLLDEALRTKLPAVHVEPLLGADDVIPKSIDEYSLKNVVCIPVSTNPGRVIYLASKRNPLRQLSDEELTHLKIASQAAVLALQQHKNFSELRDSNKRLKNALQNSQGRFLYGSQAVGTLMMEIARLAPYNVSILIQGESGVGKEELAKEIHRLSNRKGPFVAINCANLTETLLESELFGFVKGAFTGAVLPKKGLLQEAEGGTFFLDEIAELPVNLQAKLLRVLQERKVRAIGSNADCPIDVRFLAASHMSLREAVAARKFREDLYYRIQEMTVTIPPLRERPQDIELLAKHFVSHFTVEFQFPERTLSEGAIGRLVSHEWPGNIRELKNTCRSTVLLSKSALLEAEDVRIDSAPSLSTDSAIPRLAPVSSLQDLSAQGLKDITERFERDVIEKLLKQPGQTQASVAKQLNISVRTLQRIMSRDSAECYTTN